MFIASQRECSGRHRWKAIKSMVREFGPADLGELWHDSLVALRNHEQAGSQSAAWWRRFTHDAAVAVCLSRPESSHGHNRPQHERSKRHRMLLAERGTELTPEEADQQRAESYRLLRRGLMEKGIPCPIDHDAMTEFVDWMIEAGLIEMTREFA